MSEPAEAPTFGALASKGRPERNERQHLTPDTRALQSSVLGEPEIASASDPPLGLRPPRPPHVARPSRAPTPRQRIHQRLLLARRRGKGPAQLDDQFQPRQGHLARIRRGENHRGAQRTFFFF